MHDVILLISKMLSKEDGVLIDVLRVEKGYGVKSRLNFQEETDRLLPLVRLFKLTVAVFLVWIFGWFYLEYNF